MRREFYCLIALALSRLVIDSSGMGTVHIIRPPTT